MAMEICRKKERWVSTMKIYLATWLVEEGQNIVLTKKEAKRRLLSYYHCLQSPRISLRGYIERACRK